MIGDAALCLADPNCHWDGSRRGCYPGPAPFKDACAAHEAKAICDVSIARLPMVRGEQEMRGEIPLAKSRHRRRTIARA